eukprot:gnl/MRDRNA2_/MRDRNA2_70562_c0_seq1.p1 gnl/MRDRNA2_/MRDRNA2_70562_c0~~gnl/MRDRNA2_/MRDRNA2_70562_c0_seq1.p1  ORF type:complete len:824 (+),score=192.26 gnl/MRDRNA2_/MRDRNA2_70562_c0_seq1:88-2559(+)
MEKMEAKQAVSSVPTAFQNKNKTACRTREGANEDVPVPSGAPQSVFSNMKKFLNEATAKTKKYNPMADNAAHILRGDLASLQAKLVHVDDSCKSLVPDIIHLCECLQKCMKMVDVALDTDGGMQSEQETLQTIIKKAQDWQQGKQDVEGPQLFPFAENMYKVFEDLVRAVDQLKQLYGKDLDEWGIHLPTIVAVGKESAGKSSVMEMIAGQPFFPRDEGVCTRLPFRLQFRHAEQLSVSFQHHPNRAFQTPAEVQQQIKDVTFDRTKNTDISDEEVVLNIQNPKVEGLTLVDLPGLIGSGYNSEQKGLKEKVRNLAKKYINQPYAIVLAVAEAHIRLRDNEVFDMVKEAGAEERTIGLLTKCDLAEDKQFRLKEKISGSLNDANQQEQERSGYIPLKNGYFGMICRKTPEPDCAPTVPETKEAIDQVKALEERKFDEMIRDPTARSRCGTANVYKALSDMLLKYISDTWRPDVLRKLKDRIGETQQAFNNMRFSNRYKDPPSIKKVKDPEYEEEVEERIRAFSKQFRIRLNEYKLWDALQDEICNAEQKEASRKSGPPMAPEWGNALSKHLECSIQPIVEALNESLDNVVTKIRSEAEEVVEHRYTHDLPTLRKFIMDYIAEQLESRLTQCKKQLAMVAELEMVAPLPLKSDGGRVQCDTTNEHRVHPEGDDEECAICHESVLTSPNSQLDLLRCCHHRFHRQCLNNWREQTCPLCRATYERVAQTSMQPEQASHKLACKELESSKTTLVRYAKRAAASVLYNLREGNITSDLLQRATAVSHQYNASHLLDEIPEVAQKRQELHRKLEVLKKVEADVKDWGEL